MESRTIVFFFLNRRHVPRTYSNTGTDGVTDSATDSDTNNVENRKKMDQNIVQVQEQNKIVSKISH